jgi:hypothetical protein
VKEQEEPDSHLGKYTLFDARLFKKAVGGTPYRSVLPQLAVMWKDQQVIDLGTLSKNPGPAFLGANGSGALSTNTSRQIGAEETAAGGLACEPAHGTET